MLESFSSNRKQCVKNGIEYSKCMTINHGVPQGTVLGHFKFYTLYQQFPRKNEKKRGRFTVCR